MNEFIVWDTEEEEFIDMNTLYFCGNGDVWVQSVNSDNQHIMMMEQNNERFIKLPFVEKDDIDGNKIYADSSIVELVDSGSRGIFFFDEKYLKFKFAFNGDIATSLGMESFEKTVQFKIIGTLQENQELLGVNK